MESLVSLIKRFKFEELEASVMPVFPEISWASVKSKLVKHHKSFSSATAAQIIKEAALEANLQASDLKDRISTLEVIDISRHSERRVWYGYALKRPTKSRNYFLNKEVIDNVVDSLESCNVNVKVKVKLHNTITYVYIKQTQKKKIVKKIIPTVFALFLGQKFFFCAKRNPPKDYVQAVTNAMGYEHSKQLKLIGRDLKSLSKLCWRRKQGALDHRNIVETPIYKDVVPEIKHTGIDCTQPKQRRKYAEKCFGDDPPTLQLLVINGPDQTWKSEEISSNLPNESISVKWEFRSRNIATYLTNLIERRVFVTPIPYYISNLMMLGKNNITLGNDSRMQ